MEFKEDFMASKHSRVFRHIWILGNLGVELNMGSAEIDIRIGIKQ